VEPARHEHFLAAKAESVVNGESAELAQSVDFAGAGSGARTLTSTKLKGF
jgi:hypothetical protein